MSKYSKAAALAVIVLLLALPLFGCQPNPTTPPVVQKGDLEDKIKDRTPAPEGSASAAATGAGEATAAPAEPQRHTGSFTSGKLTVNIDAALELPAAGKLPVVKVTPRKFTQSEVDAIIRVLFQGKPAYKPKDKMTRAEIEQELIQMKAMKSRADGTDKQLEKFNYIIEDLEKQLKTAPETIEWQASDGKLKVDDLGGQEITVTTPLGKGQDAMISVYSSSTGRTASLWFTNEEQGESYMGRESPLTDAPRGITMPLDEAKALAEKTVRDLGSDLVLAGCSLGTCRDMTGKGGASADGPQAYLFAFTREVNGVPSTYEFDIGANVPQEEIDRNRGKGEYIEPHPYERIVMAINDTGILELQWTSPDTLREMISSDVETLPFEQVMDTFEKQFFIHNALKSKSDIGSNEYELPGDYAQSLREMGFYTSESVGYGEDVAKCTYTIGRVVLGLTRIAVKDKENEFMIVPVYDFFGTMTVEYNPETGYTGFTTDEPYHSYLTINAIDGSIINRSWGY